MADIAAVIPIMFLYLAGIPRLTACSIASCPIFSAPSLVSVLIAAFPATFAPVVNNALPPSVTITSAFAPSIDPILPAHHLAFNTPIPSPSWSMPSNAF